MGRREGFQGCRHQTVYRSRRSAPMQMQTSHNRIWVPKIPSWEKEFCYRIGQLRWEDFLEAKKLTEFSRRVLEWDDSAAEEAFHSAKKRFYSTINGLHDSRDEYSCDPDLYVDDVHWKDDDGAINSELLDGLGPAVDEKYEDEEEEEEEEEKNEDDKEEHVPDYYYIRIEDIKPTGWDVDMEDNNSRARVLTGLIVGC